MRASRTVILLKNKQYLCCVTLYQAFKHNDKAITLSVTASTPPLPIDKTFTCGNVRQNSSVLTWGRILGRIAFLGKL